MKRLLTVLLAIGLLQSLVFGASTRKKTSSKRTVKKTSVQKKIVQKKKVSSNVKRVKKAAPKHAKRRVYRWSASSVWKTPTFADSTSHDQINGEDLEIRRAAVEALGPYNGSVVVVDPSNGRILSMVNQSLALSTGFIPCSTVKLITGLAGLNEGIIDRDTQMRLSKRSSLNLTSALAHSNNTYFANIGLKLGFEKVRHYAQMLGLGEKAGFNIKGESPGELTMQPPKRGGVGMMTSFGEGISMTPLQLAAILSAIANGGKLYYLQYPTSLEELTAFEPRLKRELALDPWMPEIKYGMRAATMYGTARRANYGSDEPVWGKTGTCTDYGKAAHMGWFGSFNEVGGKQLVVVVMLTGGRPVNGPLASGIAGTFYKLVASRGYFPGQPSTMPIALISTEQCCTLELSAN
ncbi:MAG: penicillin-binding protein [Bryobacteraceae bacterium]|nr:penicillin-binding protein [Bryobacteraceae bacterium]